MIPAVQLPEALTAESILRFLADHAATLRELGVVQIGLFGSVVRGEQHAHSDIDVLVTFSAFTFKRYARLLNFLEDHLGRRVDLVPAEDLRPELRPYVLPEVRYVEGL